MTRRDAVDAAIARADAIARDVWWFRAALRVMRACLRWRYR